MSKEEEEEEEEGEEGRLRMVVEGGEGDEGEGESVGCVRSCEVFFSVGEVRRRLSKHVTAPKKTFKRDPEDPSGEDGCPIGWLESLIM